MDADRISTAGAQFAALAIWTVLARQDHAIHQANWTAAVGRLLFSIDRENRPLEWWHGIATAALEEFYARSGLSRPEPSEQTKRTEA